MTNLPFTENWQRAEMLPKQNQGKKIMTQARFQIGKVYTISSGKMFGQQKVANRVSKCGEYAWFWNERNEVGTQAEIRIHIKHTVLGKHTPHEAEVMHHDGTYIAPGEFIRGKATIELEEARMLTSELVSAKDLKRIRGFTNRLRNRSETVMAEVRALEDVTGEAAPLCDWRSFGYGIAVSGAWVALALGIGLGILKIVY